MSQDAGAWNSAGAQAIKAGDLKTALADFQKAAQLDPIEALARD